MNTTEQNTSPDWDISVNGVYVGTITDSEYTNIRRAARRDPRTAVAQLLNVAHVGLTIFSLFVRLVPLVLFWVVVGLALFDRQALASVLHMAQTADPVVLTAGIASSVHTAALLTSIALIVVPIFGARLGVRNCYAEAVGKRLRQHCNTAADGAVDVSRQVVVSGVAA